jgi:hypothetical protein
VTPREFASALGWIGVGVLFFAAVLAVTAIGAAAVLYLLGWLLHTLLIAISRWIARLWA